MSPPDARLAHDCTDAFWLIVHADNVDHAVGPMPSWVTDVVTMPKEAADACPC